MFRRVTAYVVFCVEVFLGTDGRAELRDDALAAAKKAATFYSRQVATKGGYLWRYSADLTLREGEGNVTGTTVWVQPPGTPAVGEAYVKLYDATSEPLFLDAAGAAAEALRRGQLRSGGWNDHIDFDPADRTRTPYRLDPPGAKKRTPSSLDDDKTQSAIRFLAQLDRSLEFKDEAVHEMTLFALDGLLGAQYPNGGFPQVWDEPHRPEDFPVMPAGYPRDWPRMYPGHGSYWFRYTLNDDLVPDVIHALFLAEAVYGGPRYRQAVLKAADFLLLAQLPDPQPAWAQQYDFEMHPAWARKFEPPAVTGGESQGVLRILLEVYRRTGERKYLEPVPRAVAYLKKSLLPDGRLARFYELQSNRPLYFTKDYTLTYNDSDLPTHYGFKVASKLDEIEKEYEALSAGDKQTTATKPGRVTRGMEDRARAAIEGLDDRGAWVTEDKLRYQAYVGPIIDMSVAVKNLNVLADYLAATIAGS
ncbi:MAG TPA: pectate lyase [Pirellulales bacterium]|nr:pectate lyase [Pirellulales bacterium]